MSGESATPDQVVCKCNHCPELIAFEPSNVGQTVQCPRCGMDTILFVPNTRPAPPKAALPKARIVTEKFYIETGAVSNLELGQQRANRKRSDVDFQLEFAGTVFMVLGILGAIGSLAGCIATTGNGDRFAPGYILVGVAFIFQGFVVRLFFKAGAEIIRLLGDLTTNSFAGRIIQLATHERFKCSLCNASAEPGQASCRDCGAEFKETEPT
jgi:hypothetical protein